MKFLCPSCKAKYQVADEKIAGKKSVRMKCRKCGYVIEVSKLAGAASGGSEAPESAPPARPSERPPTPRPPPPRAGAIGARDRLPPAPRPPAAAAVRAPLARPAAAGGGGPLSPLPYDDEDATRIATGGLASAFSATVADAPPSTLEGVRFSDEWYVGINGVPVGPMRLTTLRQKAGQGAVSSGSLVWREGFDEWLPLSTYPELVAVVEEGLSSARASFEPPTALPGRPGEVAIHSVSQIPQDPLAGIRLGPGSQEADVGVAADFPAGMPRRGTPMLAWIAVVVALLTGVTIGFVLVSTRKPPEPIIKYVEVPASGRGQFAAAPEDSAGAPAMIDEAEVTGGKVGAGGPIAKAGTLEDDKGTGKTGLSGLDGLGGVRSGPAGGPDTRAAGGGGGGKLDAAILQRTVARYTPSVRRACWQPALNMRAENAPTSARVGVSITVSPSGGVSSVSTSGEPKGYRGLAGCIASRVKSWSFPASSESTTVNVPFVFAAQ